MTVNTNANTIRQTERRTLGNGLLIRANYGMQYIKGNAHGYFSLTCDTFEVRNGRTVVVGGGAAHESIAKAFPELADLVPFHLCDENGLPMHYVANAVYWAELAVGISDWQECTQPPNGRSFMDVLADHCLASVLGDRAVLEEKVERFRIWSKVNPRLAKLMFKGWLQRRLHDMQEAFNAAMSKHGVERLAN